MKLLPSEFSSTLFLLLLRSTFLLAASNSSAYISFNFTAIAGDGKLNSQLECWQTASPLQPIPSLQGSFYLPFNSSPDFAYAIFPPKSDAGLHNYATSPQWIVILSGLAKISIPAPEDNSTASNLDNGTAIYVDSWTGGPGALILATDIASVSARGHDASWPGDSVTASLMLPISADQIPAHSVLHTGVCTQDEMMFAN